MQAEVKNLAKSTSEYSETFDEWAAQGETVTGEFLEEKQAGDRHKAGLREAKKTFSEAYDGEPKDLTAAIDDEVMEAIGGKVAQILASDTAVAAALSGLAAESDSPLTTYEKAKLRRLTDVAGSLNADLKMRRRLLQRNQEATQAVQENMRRLGDEFSGYRLAPDMMGDIARRYGRNIDVQSGHMHEVIARSATLLRQVSRQVHSLQ